MSENLIIFNAKVVTPLGFSARKFSVPIFTDLSVILQPYIKKSNLQDNNN